MATKKVEKKRKFPATLAGCAKKYATLSRECEAWEAQVKLVADELAALREYLLETLKKAELDGLTTSGLRFSVVTTSVPTMADFKAFMTFAAKKKNWDLLQKSVNSPAWRERLAAGVQVPGVTTFDRVGLRITKVRGGDGE